MTVWKLLVTLVIVIPIVLSGLDNLRDGDDLFGWTLWGLSCVAGSLVAVGLARVLHGRFREYWHRRHCSGKSYNLLTVEHFAAGLIEDMAQDPDHRDIILRDALRNAYHVGRFDAQRPREDRWTPPESVGRSSQG